MNDPHDLQRFVAAQEPVYARVLEELRAGRKQSHWMWFIFPQIAGLGHSVMARRYAIGSRAGAEAYLDHPVLGMRLRACTKLVNAVNGKTIHEIFGSPDDMKFRSSMTLFATSARATSARIESASGDAEFIEALAKYFDSHFDEATLSRL